jgi:hypothetical protein
MPERMKKLLTVTRPQEQMDVESSSTLTMPGLRAARIRVNDPLAVGIEEFLCPIRFVPSRLPISQNPNEKRERRRCLR